MVEHFEDFVNFDIVWSVCSSERELNPGCGLAAER